MSKLDQKTHWDRIYETRSETDFSWFQSYPETSLKFIKLFDLLPNSRIIDVGGGDSHLVDALLEIGFRNIYVLDISEKAIERARKRLGNDATLVNWIIKDVLDFHPLMKFDLWHDRAAFHFLTTYQKIRDYLAIAKKSIKQNGFLTLGTFSEKGPTRCSGLEIKRYSELSMSKLFEQGFDRIKCIEENHLTPFKTIQSFTFCSFKRS